MRREAHATWSSKENNPPHATAFKADVSMTITGCYKRIVNDLDGTWKFAWA
jgi:hypothetical protein